MIARASSGSRSSINSVEPLMSANSAVTVLRSPSSEAASPCSAATEIVGVEAVTAGDLPEPSGRFSGAVHCPQNLKPGGFSTRHLGQTSASGAVHWPQYFIPPGFSKPHLEQRIGSPPNFGRPMREYRRNTGQRKQTHQRLKGKRPGVVRGQEPLRETSAGSQDLVSLSFSECSSYAIWRTYLSPGLILGLQFGLIGLDKFTKLGSAREQRIPLLQVERDREPTETIY